MLGAQTLVLDGHTRESVEGLAFVLPSTALGRLKFYLLPSGFHVSV